MPLDRALQTIKKKPSVCGLGRGGPVSDNKGGMLTVRSNVKFPEGILAGSTSTSTLAVAVAVALRYWWPRHTLQAK
jgi:hypothetical protein